MRLTAADVAELPLPVALVDVDGALLAASPEWRGAGPGATTFALGGVRLVVAADDADADIGVVTARLVAELRAAAESVGDCGPARRMTMLAAGVALVAGAAELRRGTTADVHVLLDAAVAAVSATPVTLVAHQRGAVPDTSLVALALKQLVVNARRHDDATAVTLRIENGPSFVLEWDGLPPPDGVTTARHQAERERWGLGYVRLAADAVGGVALAPIAIAPGRVQAIFALEAAPRLQLPLAAIADDGRVERASPAWDEETGLAPGTALSRQLADLVEAARSRPGVVVADGPRRARHGARRTWVAVPPQGSRDRAIDAIRGLAHEQDLWAAPEPHRTRVQGLALLLGLLLGDPMPRYSPEAFVAEFPAACAALGMRAPARLTPLAVAPDPSLAAYLMWSLDASATVSTGGCVLIVPQHRRGDPVARRLADRVGRIAVAQP